MSSNFYWRSYRKMSELRTRMGNLVTECRDLKNKYNKWRKCWRRKDKQSNYFVKLNPKTSNSYKNYRTRSPRRTIMVVTLTTKKSINNCLFTWASTSAISTLHNNSSRERTRIWRQRTVVYRSRMNIYQVNWASIIKNRIFRAKNKRNYSIRLLYRMKTARNCRIVWLCWVRKMIFYAGK